MYSGSAGTGAGVNMDGVCRVRAQSKQMSVFFESEQSGRMHYSQSGTGEVKDVQVRRKLER